jgi:hypothetical protein
MFVRSELEIAEVVKYRYFEVEVIENEKDSEIYIGLIGSNSGMPTKIGGGKGLIEDEEDKQAENLPM